MIDAKDGIISLGIPMEKGKVNKEILNKIVFYIYDAY
jgi:hypothetical protein